MDQLVFREDKTGTHMVHLNGYCSKLAGRGHAWPVIATFGGHLRGIYVLVKGVLPRSDSR